jgi:tRNA(Ile)-lysidine synthase
MHPLEAKLAAGWPPIAWQDVTVLVAVSGGADSVALLLAMSALKTAGEGRLVAAHLNHQLRLEESAADERFVVELCGRLRVPCEVGHAQIAAAAREMGDGLEAAARRARYEFLEQAAGRAGARYVVTAHTADDQAETIVHRVVRGTGLRGLAGMARARPLGPVTLIRPLLGVRRTEILAYLNDRQQPFRRDSSNLDLRFTRNRIRHDLLPCLAAEFNPGIVDALLRLGSLAGEAQAVLDGLVAGLAERCVRQDGSETVRIDVAPLRNQHRYVIRELLMAAWRRQGWSMQAMGWAEWELLAEMTVGAGMDRGTVREKRTFPGRVLAEANDQWLVLTRPA